MFRLHANVTNKQKIQRKLNFVRHVPEDSLRLHIDNLLSESDKNSEPCDVKFAKKREETGSVSSSFVFERRRGVKRKLDFDADEASDEVSSYKFSSRNISLCGFQSKNSSLFDVKSLVLTPSKRRVRGSRSSIASTCRRRLFSDLEPDPKRPKLESPVLCQKSKKKEVKLSLKKKFPGVPNSNSARSGLLLNLAFSKYNLSTDKEDVSIDFVDKSAARTAKKDDSAFRHSPVFQAIKKVKRRLDLEKSASKEENVNRGQNSRDESVSRGRNSCSDGRSQGLNDAVTNPSVSGYQAGSSMVSDAVNAHDAGTVEATTGSQEQKKGGPSPRTKSTEKCRNDLFKNSKVRPLLRNEIFNLSRPSYVYNYKKSIVDVSPIPHRPRPDRFVAKSCKKSKAESVYARIIVNRSPLEVRNDLENSSSERSCQLMASKTAKKWFNDSFNKKRSDLRKSLFHRKKDAFLESHMQRFLKDCVNAIGQEVTQEESQTEGKLADENAEGYLDIAADERNKNTESQDLVTHMKEQNFIADSPPASNIEQENIFGDPKFVIEETSPKENLEPVESCFSNNAASQESAKNQLSKDDLVVEDISSQEIGDHCVEEVLLIIDSPGSSDEFSEHPREDGLINDSLIERSQRLRILDESIDYNRSVIFGETSEQPCQQLSILVPDFRVSSWARFTYCRFASPAPVTRFEYVRPNM